MIKQSRLAIFDAQNGKKASEKFGQRLRLNFCEFVMIGESEKCMATCNSCLKGVNYGNDNSRHDDDSLPWRNVSS